MKEVCPRCGTDPLTKYPALSRADDATSICPKCGTDEALEQFYSPDHTVTPKSAWPMARKYEVPEPMH